jgi:acetyl-CoA carboxylase biotin carboxyl carrier protein
VAEAAETDEPPTIDEVAAIVRELAECMQATGLTRLDVQMEGVKIKMRAGTAAIEGESVPVPLVASVAPTAPSPGATSNSHIVTAPMIGTFYLSAAPGQAPFVQPGDHVDAGQTIGIIEAMKIMNEIPSDRAGIVDEILVTNGEAVEYGSALIRLTLDGGAG